jgi:hypothetical protein
MTHVPPPLTHVFFSASRAHENASVMGVTSGFALMKFSRAEVPAASGTHVALVNRSTDFSRKNFGNVPPRFETLSVLAMDTELRYGATHVANRVMYVPPISGSAILA